MGVLLTALVLTFVQAPSAALAEGGVAKVGDAEYATFDEAFAATRVLVSGRSSGMGYRPVTPVSAR